MTYKNGDKVMDLKFKEVFVYEDERDAFVVEKYPDRFELIE